MKSTRFILSLVLTSMICFHTRADDYRSGLLNTSEDIPAARSLLGATEDDVLTRIAPAGYWGKTAARIDVAGQPFSRAWRIPITSKPGNPWGGMLKGKVPVAISKGQVCTFIFFARAGAFGDEVPKATIEAIPSKESRRKIELGPDWQRIDLPFTSTKTYAPETMEVAIFLAFDRQIVEIGGMALLTFDEKVDIKKLPALPKDYGTPRDYGQLDTSIITGAQIDETTIDVVVHVDPANPSAKDTNDGSPESPLLTYVGALERAKVSLRAGQSTKISLHPGTYREGGRQQITLNGNTIGGKAVETLLVIEGTEPGKVTLSGSDLYAPETWTPIRSPEGDILYYTHDWPHSFALDPSPYGSAAPRGVRAHHLEMLYCNGKLMSQQLVELYTFEVKRGSSGTGTHTYVGFSDPAEVLTPGSFAVANREENGKRLFFMPPAGTDFQAATIEVTTRDEALRVYNKQNLVLRNLTVQHFASSWGGGAVFLIGAKEFTVDNVLIEDCDISRNNGSGLYLIMSQRQTLRRVTLNYNGVRGLGGWNVDNMIIEDCDTSFNNWRGHWGGFYGWAVAGAKLTPYRNLYIKRLRAIGNLSYGLWFDKNNQNILVEDSRFCGNINGVYVEIAPGPIHLRRCLMSDNRKSGIRVNESNQLTIEHCLIMNNGNQVNYAGREDGRNGNKWGGSWPLPNGEQSPDYKMVMGRVSAHNNILIATTPEQTIYGMGPRTGAGRYADFLKRLLSSDGNRYFGVTPDEAFGLGPEIYGNLNAWRTASGQDANSEWANIETLPENGIPAALDGTALTLEPFSAAEKKAVADFHQQVGFGIEISESRADD